MNEVALFESALRVAVPTRPDPMLGRELVPRLAQAARASMLEAETRTHRRRPRSRFALVARVGIAVALIPLVLAGLAFAGVTVPSPARSAFDSVGITLPNQPSDQSAGSKAKDATTTIRRPGTTSRARRRTHPTGRRAATPPRHTVTRSRSARRPTARPSGTATAARSGSAIRRRPATAGRPVPRRTPTPAATPAPTRRRPTPRRRRTAPLAVTFRAETPTATPSSGPAARGP